MNRPSRKRKHDSRGIEKVSFELAEGETEKDLQCGSISSKETTETSQSELKTIPRNRLKLGFYDVECTVLARILLGQKIVHNQVDHRLCGRIVETEAYLGLEDKAAHSYKGKRTQKTEAMFMAPGTSYVYNIYGMYCCFNVSSQGEGCAVLIRAIEPLEGQEQMFEVRGAKTQKKMKEKDLGNGPSKLCQALSITKTECNKLDLIESQVLWLEKDDSIPETQIVKSKRIGINYAEEWKDKLLRYYILGNQSVSVRDKEAEKTLTQSVS